MSGRPIRIQRSRAKGWRMPPNTVYVGRGTDWGNPFVVGKPSGLFDGETLIDALSPTQAIEFYETALHGMLRPEMHPHGHLWLHRWHDVYGSIPSTLLGALRGKNLACWCGLDKPCHADVLLELANR